MNEKQAYQAPSLVRRERLATIVAAAVSGLVD
jgi:hypothetical protein